MTRVLHLIDDAGMGGVMRVLRDHLPRLGDGFQHTVGRVGTAWRLPGPIAADIVVIHFTINWAKLPFLAALRVGLPHAQLVVVEHSYTEAYERLCVRRRGRFRALLRLAYGMADRVVAVSRAQAAWLLRANVVPDGRLVVIPQACDTTALTALPLPAATGGPLRLGAYGRYAPQKGFDVLIEAMRAVPPNLATLEFAGQGPDLAMLRAAAADLPHVSIGGPVDGPIGFLARVDAVVVPSRWEAFGLVAAEARAAGRPVLATRTDGLVEQIDASWGALVAAEDASALATEICSLASRDRRTMGVAARRSVGAALDVTIAQWSALLGEIAPARRHVAPASAGTVVARSGPRPSGLMARLFFSSGPGLTRPSVPALAARNNVTRFDRGGQDGRVEPGHDGEDFASPSLRIQPGVRGSSLAMTVGMTGANQPAALAQAR